MFLSLMFCVVFLGFLNSSLFSCLTTHAFIFNSRSLGFLGGVVCIVASLLCYFIGLLVCLFVCQTSVVKGAISCPCNMTATFFKKLGFVFLNFSFLYLS